MRPMLRAVTIALMAGALAACDEPVPGPQGGEAARIDGLVMERLDGGSASIEAYRGKLVVLNVWATWCPPCRREMPGLQKLADTLDPERFAVLGLATDENPALVREYLRQKGLGFARYIDRSGARAFGPLEVSALPTTIVIAPDGRILWEAAGERDWGDPAVVAWLQGLM